MKERSKQKIHQLAKGQSAVELSVGIALAVVGTFILGSLLYLLSPRFENDRMNNVLQSARATSQAQATEDANTRILAQTPSPTGEIYLFPTYTALPSITK